MDCKSPPNFERAFFNLFLDYFFISGAPVCHAWPTFSPMA